MNIETQVDRQSFCYFYIEMFFHRFSVHAVWAGWGHASENPKLPKLLHQVFILFPKQMTTE